MCNITQRFLKRSQTFQTDKSYCGVFQPDVKLFHHIPWCVVVCQKRSGTIAAFVLKLAMVLIVKRAMVLTVAFLASSCTSGFMLPVLDDHIREVRWFSSIKCMIIFFWGGEGQERVTLKIPCPTQAFITFIHPLFQVVL